MGMTMNYVRTGMLMAGLTALFGAVGYLLGGGGGMLMALGFAAVTNLFSYWNSDRLALAAHNAHEVDERSAPELYGMVRGLAARANMPMPRLFIIQEDQPNAFATGRNPENAAVAVNTGLINAAVPRGGGRRHRPRARPHQEPRHADHDDHRDAGRRDLHARQFRRLFGEQQQREPQRLRHHRHHRHDDPGAAGRLHRADGHFPLARIRGGQDGRGDLRQPDLARRSALAKIAGGVAHTVNGTAEHNPQTAHMFIINPLSGERMDNLFSTHPDTGNRIAA
jgi:heat shock protein HtpX